MTPERRHAVATSHHSGIRDDMRIHVSPCRIPKDARRVAMRWDCREKCRYVSLLDSVSDWLTQWRATCDGSWRAQWSTMSVAKLKVDGSWSGETGTRVESVIAEVSCFLDCDVRVLRLSVSS